MISEKHNPFGRINLTAIIKITDFNWYSHYACDNPYIQISIDGLVLDGTGDVVPAHIEDSEGYDDYIKVDELVRLYMPGSLHWIESHTFHFMEGELCFWHPTRTHPVAAEDIKGIERFFLRESPSNCEPQKQTGHRIITTSNVCQDMDNHTVVMSGVIEHIHISCTKRGRKMATARLRDPNGIIDLIIYPDVYENYEKTLSKKGKFTVTGRIDVSEISFYFIPDSFELSER